MSRARPPPGARRPVLLGLRPALGNGPRLLRALRHGARRQGPLLQSLWIPRRRLTIAFSLPVSYQSASLNSGARREPMGLAIVGRAAARSGDGFDGGCAAAAPARDRDAVRSHLRRTCRLQLRRRRSAPRRPALLATHARSRALSHVRLLLRERRIAVGAEFRSEIPATHPLRRVVRRRRIELVARELRWRQRKRHQSESAHRT